MKRLVLVLLALVLLAAGGFTWVSRQAGLEVAEAIAEQQAFVARQPWLRIVSQTYDRGLFASTASATVELRGPYAEAVGQALARAAGIQGPVRLAYLHDIRHGPLPNWRQGDLTPARAVVETRFRLEGDLGNRLPELFGPEAPALVVTEFIDAQGGIAHLRLPAVSRDLAGGARLAWQGLAGDIRFTRAYDSIRSDLAMPALELTGRDGRAALNRISLKADMRLGAHGLWLGTADARAGEFTANWPGMNLVATGAGYRTGVTEVGEFLDVTGDMGAEGIEAQAEKAGPVRLAFSVKHLHGPTVKALRDAAEALQQRNLKPREEMLEQMALTRRFVGDLMRHQPELRIDELSFRMPAGDLKLSFALRVARYDEESAANPLKALDGIEADLDLDLAEPLALALGEKALRQRGRLAMPGAVEDPEADGQARSAASDQINALVVQGHLVRDGDRLKTSARWREGGLKVNGFPVGVPFARPAESPPSGNVLLPPPDLPPRNPPVGAPSPAR
ncbi:MAG: YdgA family protein [Rhodocyclaceae bacterium]|nr:YdgA family protein [Rhodocyclaceae bacterium]